MFDLYRVYWSW